jgi:hypothetical protein
MKSLVQKLLLLSLAVAIAVPLAAQDKEKKKDKKNGGEPAAIAKMKGALAKAELKDDQKKKVDELVAQYSPKLSEAAKAAGEAPKKVGDAKKKLKDEGKKQKEINAEYKAVAKLTADEQAAFDKLEKLGEEFRAAVLAVLTDEQKDKAGLSKGKKKGKA